MGKVLATLALTAALPLLAPAPGRGATFVVDTIADGPDMWRGDGVCLTADGTCTLRAALTEANASTGPDVIQLGSGPHAWTIGSTLAVIGDIDIRGIRSDFTALPPVGVGGIDVDVSGHLILENVDLPSVHPTAGATVLRRCLVMGTGVTLDTPDATLELDDCHVSSNRRPGCGAGMRVMAGSVHAIRCTFIDNQVMASSSGFSVEEAGGGICVDGGTVLIESSEISGNTVSASNVGPNTAVLRGIGKSANAARGTPDKE